MCPRECVTRNWKYRKKDSSFHTWTELLKTETLQNKNKTTPCYSCGINTGWRACVCHSHPLWLTSLVSNNAAENKEHTADTFFFIRGHRLTDCGAQWSETWITDDCWFCSTDSGDGEDLDSAICGLMEPHAETNNPLWPWNAVCVCVCACMCQCVCLGERNQLNDQLQTCFTLSGTSVVVITTILGVNSNGQGRASLPAPRQPHQPASSERFTGCCINGI